MKSTTAISWEQHDEPIEYTPHTISPSLRAVWTWPSWRTANVRVAGRDYKLIEFIGSNAKGMPMSDLLILDRGVEVGSCLSDPARVAEYLKQWLSMAAREAAKPRASIRHALDFASAVGLDPLHPWMFERSNGSGYDLVTDTHMVTVRFIDGRSREASTIELFAMAHADVGKGRALRGPVTLSRAIEVWNQHAAAA